MINKRNTINEANLLLANCAKGNVSSENPLRPEEILTIRSALCDLLAKGGKEADREEIKHLKQKLNLLNLICDLYDYQYPKIDIKKINAGVSWSSINTNELFERLLADFDQEENLNMWGVNHDVVFGSSDIESATGHLGIESGIKFDVTPMDETKIAYIRLIDKAYRGRDKRLKYPGVTEFGYHKKGDIEEWDFQHRLVHPAYRAQGIAHQMLQLMKDFIMKRAKLNKRKQRLISRTALLDVLVMLIREEFLPISEEDKERLNRVLSGDSSLTIISSPHFSSREGPFYGFIFEKEKLDHYDSSLIWSHNRTHEAHYLNSAFRIGMKKDI